MSGARSDRGAVAIMTALLAVVLLVSAAFAVDLGNTWARRGQLQVQADRAATYAARLLPADSDQQRAAVAKAVAYYLACHAVIGQRELDPSIPACPTASSSSTLDAYAAALLAHQMVTFPVRNQVRVMTPTARVDYGFAAAVGVDHSMQQKTATAKVTSPGAISPMGLSLDCLLSPAAGTATRGGVPFGYISTTHSAGSSSAVAPTWTNATAAAPTDLGITPGSVQQQMSGAGPAALVSAAGWPDPAPLTATVVFAQAAKRYTVTGPLVMNGGRNRKRIGTVSVTIPAQVVGPLGAGTWEARISVPPNVTSSTAYLEVRSGPAATSYSCGRLVKSPRGGTNAVRNFVLNLQLGLDHLLSTYPGIVAAHPVTADVLRTVAAATQCGSSGVRDDVNPSGTPNCLITNMSGAYENGFTEGMVGPDGRLACTSARPCAGRTFVLNGRTLNDDKFTDFVRNPSLLSSSTFFNLDTYLDTGIPVVTPTSNLQREIYNSQRFLWVAVLSTAGATSAVQAGDYPVLTFRPIFITQASALTTDNLPLLGPTDPIAPYTRATATSYLDQLAHVPLGAWQDKEGLLMDGTTLKAVRFLTISPDALPAVPADYAGPESEYVGVGPRIIRLVE